MSKKFAIASMLFLLIAGGCQFKQKNDSEQIVVDHQFVSRCSRAPVDDLDRQLGKERHLVNAKNDIGLTCLMVACFKGQNQKTKWLLNNGANPNLKDKQLASPLHYAAQRSSWESVGYLLENGAEIDSRDMLSFTPIMMSARFGDLKTNKILVEGNASLTTKDDQGWNALFFTVPRGNLEIFKYFVSIFKSNKSNNSSKNKNISLDPKTLYELAVLCIEYNKPEFLKALLSKNEDAINFFPQNKRSLLGQSIRLHTQEIAKWLLSQGADTRLKDGTGRRADEYLKEQNLKSEWLHEKSH